jgi:hypothetical protein
LRNLGGLIWRHASLLCSAMMAGASIHLGLSGEGLAAIWAGVASIWAVAAYAQQLLARSWRNEADAAQRDFADLRSALGFQQRITAAEMRARLNRWGGK